jgi:hypothetical protein
LKNPNTDIPTKMSSEFDSVPGGYPQLAALLAKEQDFFIIRKFQGLNARNILYLQGELTDVEDKLEQLDKELLGQTSGGDLKSWATFSADPRGRELVIQMRTLLAGYSE